MINVILVNEHDEEKGIAEKIYAHQQGYLHRAFSIFVYRSINNVIEILLQKRAQEKYHSKGLWANTCCGHPKPGENITQAAAKRLTEEMGMIGNPRHMDQFIYKADLNDGMHEHELDHLLVCEYNGSSIQPNPDEVCATEWMTIPDIQKDYIESQDQYAAWFKPAFDRVCQKMNWQ